MKITALTVAAIAGFFLLVGSARADHLNGNGVTVIDADQLKAWIDLGKKMLLVDSREKYVFLPHVSTSLTEKSDCCSALLWTIVAASESLSSSPPSQ